MNPLISVIVPIYMIDRYLGLCIESITSQTYKELEIILVDDGGSDRCSEICDLYSTKDSRIKVIHKPNGGLVSARKRGLIESKGNYICYVDGDDWIGQGFVGSLFAEAKNNDADIVCAGFTRDLFSKSAIIYNAIPSGIYSNSELVDLWENMISFGPFYRPGITTYVWNKLFKREVLYDSQINVDDRITIGEDAAVSYPAILRSKKIVVTDNVAYHYRQREDSMLKKHSSYYDDARKLKFLRDYLQRWANKYDSSLKLSSQIDDFILANSIMRSGGKLPDNSFSTYDSVYYGKDVIVYSAGTFGQQLVNRFKETNLCNVVKWIDDDYNEYRRCCLNVDSVSSINEIHFDYVLIAKVDERDIQFITRELLDFGVSEKQILSIKVPQKKTDLIEKFLAINSSSTDYLI